MAESERPRLHRNPSVDHTPETGVREGGVADHDALAARLAAAYHATPDPDAAQVDACTRAVLAAAMHQVERSPLGAPHIRWWWGAAAGLAAAAVVVLTVRRPDAPEAALAAVHGTVATEATGAVRFDLRLPASAKAVAVVGDFNDWRTDATPMARRATDNTWSAQIHLTPGRHAYAFVVDGTTWVVDPLAPQVPDSGYGPSNAIVVEAVPGGLP